MLTSHSTAQHGLCATAVLPIKALRTGVQFLGACGGACEEVAPAAPLGAFTLQFALHTAIWVSQPLPPGLFQCAEVLLSSWSVCGSGEWEVWRDSQAYGATSRRTGGATGGSRSAMDFVSGRFVPTGGCRSTDGWTLLRATYPRQT